MELNTLIITQARYSSTRLEGKVLKPLNNGTLLDLHLKRLKRSKTAEGFLVATTTEPQALEIISVADRQGWLSFRGSMDDVLDRFYQSCKDLKVKVVVRVTSDCPLNDGELVDEVIRFFESGDYDYVSNIHPPSFPDGMDVEVFRFEALEKAWKESTSKRDREHVTPYIWENPQIFKLGNYSRMIDKSSYRMTVDHPQDYELIKRLVNDLGEDRPWFEYLSYLESSENLLNINQQYIRNESFKG